MVCARVWVYIATHTTHLTVVVAFILRSLIIFLVVLFSFHFTLAFLFCVCVKCRCVAVCFTFNHRAQYKQASEIVYGASVRSIHIYFLHFVTSSHTVFCWFVSQSADWLEKGIYWSNYVCHERHTTTLCVCLLRREPLRILEWMIADGYTIRKQQRWWRWRRQ